MKNKHWIFIIFLFALTVRMLLLNYIIHHDINVILQPDSSIYISLAEGIKKYGAFCDVDSPAQPNAERMPIYPFFLAFITHLTGLGYASAVFVQIILDVFSCILIFFLAEQMSKGSGPAAGLLASVNINMLAYSNFILNDSLFLFVFLLVLLYIKIFMMRESRFSCALTGIGLGFATLIRPVAMYLPFFVMFFFVIFVRFKFHRPWIPAIAKSLLIFGGFLIMIFPWSLRNYLLEGRLKLTSQYGEQLFQYIVPSVWEHSRNISFIEAFKKADMEFQASALKQGHDLKTMRPFSKADLQAQWALEALKAEPKSAIVKAWITGITKNLFAPALVDFSYLLNIERPHFFYMQGESIVARIFHFIKGMKGIFSLFFFFSLFLMGIFRLLQLWGLILLCRKNLWASGFMVLIISYFLLISGPVGYAKYRLPFEPILIVLTAVGIMDLFRKWTNRKAIASERMECLS
ncbi:MAG: hypothetical protein EHM45_17645 [Desulfobacteraceae bacterium]|nr:MAG: hypothetical protein EHM45_17645 [Desulfobacteraceae bacterium]